MPMRQTLRPPKTVTNYDSSTNSWITSIAPTPQSSTSAPQTVNIPSPPQLTEEQAQYVTDLALRPRPMPFGSNNSNGSHARSLSQTIPAIFRGNRKVSAAPHESHRSSPQDPFSTDPITPQKKSGTKKQDDGNSSTGRCATCGGKVTYPKGVMEYRCTVCLMVNDLKIRPPRHIRRGETPTNESGKNGLSYTGQHLVKQIQTVTLL